MPHFNWKSLSLTVDDIDKILKSCKQLSHDTEPADYEDEGNYYSVSVCALDVTNGMLYTLVPDLNKLIIKSGATEWLNYIEDTEDMLPILRDLVMKSTEYEAKISDADKTIFSILGKKPTYLY